jgi:WD40 repeat protein
MSWPLSQDYNEAIQNPQQCLADPDLRASTPATNALGLPMPRSGNFADVYQFQHPDGRSFALKCFTRAVTGLQERYQAIDAHLQTANLPFTVGFTYLPDGVQVRGQWYPALKMQWVEGFTLNEFVRQHADKPGALDALAQMWARLCKRSREVFIAHGDLQHGNILLVPGKGTSLGLKLIDYDGMWVPALADKPSGEVGHPAFQHPQRLKDGTYRPIVDRFPHLVIATALRALAVGGPALWQRYDNGDNLLFREVDFANPGQSALFAELWKIDDAVTHALVGQLALGATQPIEQTPWLDQFWPEGGVPQLTPEQTRHVKKLLSGTRTTRPAAAVAAQPDAVIESELTLIDGPGTIRPKPANYLPALVGGGVAAVLALGAIVGVVAYSGKKPTEPVAQAPADKPTPKAVVKDEPPPTPDPVKPTPKGPDPVMRWEFVNAGPHTLAYAPGGQHIAGPGPEHSVRVRTLDGTEVGRLAGTEPVVAVTYADAETLIVARADKSLATWAGKTDAEPKPLETKELKSAPVRVLAVAEYVLAAEADGTLRVWDRATGKLLRTITRPTPTAAVASAVASDGTTIVAAEEGQLAFFDLATGEPKGEPLRQRSLAEVADLVASPDGKLIACLTDQGEKVQLRELATGRSTGKVLTTAKVVPGTLTFTPDSARLVLSTDAGVQIWDVTSGELTATVKPATPARSVSIATDGRSLALGHAGPEATVWALPEATTAVATPKPVPPKPAPAPIDGLRVLAGHTTPVRAVGFLADARVISLADGKTDKTLRIWDVVGGKELKAIELPQAIRGFVVLPDGQRVLTWGAEPTDKTVRLIDTQTGKELTTIDTKVGRNGIYNCAISPGGQVVVTAGALDNAFSAFNLMDGKRVGRVQVTAQVVPRSVAFDGRRLAVGANDGIIYVYDLLTSTELVKLTGHKDDVLACKFTPDGQLVSAGKDKTIRLWDVMAGMEKKLVGTVTRAIHGLIITDDVRNLLVGDAGGSVHVYDLATGKETLSLNVQRKGAPPSIVTDVALAPDGLTLAIGNSDRNVLLVPTPKGLELVGMKFSAVSKISDPLLAGGNSPLLPTALREPVPEKADLDKAERDIKQTYAGDYAKTTLADRRLFAEKLLKVGLEENGNKAIKFVLLREARDIAKDTVTVETAARAIDALGDDFAVDAGAMKVEALTELEKKTQQAVNLVKLAETALAGADKAAAFDHYDIAAQLVNVGKTAAQRAANTPLLTRLAAKDKALQKMLKDFEAVKAAAETLKKTPRDPAANLKMAQFQCFVKEEWNLGLRLMLLCGDPKLVKLAENDLKEPLGTMERMELADGWWDYAETLPEEQKANCLKRAKDWYKRALSSNELAGLARAKAEERTKLVFDKLELKPGLFAATYGDLKFTNRGKTRIDPSVDFTSGKFPDGLPQLAAPYVSRWQGYLLPTKAGQYRITADVNDTTDYVRLTVGTAPVADGILMNKPGKRTVVVTLPEKPVSIKLDYVHGQGNRGKIALKWELIGGFAETVIPSEVLHHDVKQDADLK